MNELRFHAGVV